MTADTKNAQVAASVNRVYTATFIGTNLVEITQNNVARSVWTGPYPIPAGTAGIEPEVIRQLNARLALLAP